MAAIIFDLDGTIADSFDYVANYIAKSAGLGPLSEEQKLELHGLSMATMARKLGVAWWRLPRLFYTGRTTMSRSMAHVQPFAGMPELIAKLHAEGHELFIVSSNSLHNVRTFLHHYKLHIYFLELYGGIGLFGKAPTLRKLLKDQHLEVKHCVYVGDELRDVEAAQAVAMPVIAVGWGFARHQDLRDLHPKAIASSPEHLLRLLEMT